MEIEKKRRIMIYACLAFALILIIGVFIFLWINIEYVKMFQANPCGICIKENPGCFCTCMPKAPSLK